MCGIAGFVDRVSDLSIANADLLKKMSRTLLHRGPDSSAFWHDTDQGVYLAHQRLSIIDLSEEGAQPMASSCGRFVLTYNGEIYNFLSLKRQLQSEGHTFRGESDTEVLIEYIARFGLHETLKKIKGMFAFALWDKQKKKLSLVRDHFGKKPLYFGMAGQKLFFASELKAAMPLFPDKPPINGAAFNQFIRFGFISAPHSIYEGVYKLKPAHFIEFDFSDAAVRLDAREIANRMRPYWNAQESAYADNKQHNDIAEIKKTFKTSLINSVKERMMSDVPLGAFLSGGLDSSLIVSVMQVISDKPIQTFSIGFGEAQYNEAEYAKAVAKHLGTDHKEFYVTDDEARSIIPQLSTIYDEPFADISQIPTYYVCKKASDEVTVVLSGDGGDEFFYGYSRYFMIRKLYKKFKNAPYLLKKLLSSAILACPAALLGGGKSFGFPVKRLHKIAECLDARDFDETVFRALSCIREPQSLTVFDQEAESVFSPGALSSEITSPEDRLMMFDILQYMTDDVLVKVDRASMANSIEVRSPLMDKDLMEWSMSLPASHKIAQDGVSGKRMLRDLVYEYLPRELIDRPKQGFSVPVAQWLRGPLNEWANDYLSVQSLEKSGLYQSRPVHKLWRSFERGHHERTEVLWSILMAQTWHETWRS